MRARPVVVMLLAGVVLGAALSAPATAGDGDSLAGALLTLAPGDTVAWIDARDQEGRGVVARPDTAALRLADGRRLPAEDLARLWRRRLSRGPGFARGLGGGMALGVLGCVAAVNLYGRDGGGLENLGAGVLGLASLAAGALGGTLVGAAMPAERTWDLLYPDVAESEAPPRPPGYAGPRGVWAAPHVTLGANLLATGWRSEREASGGASVGIQWPLADGTTGGVSLGLAAVPDFDGARAWTGTGPLTALARVRIRLGRGDDPRAYLGVGGGYDGRLGGHWCWLLAFGARTYRGARTEVGVEAGTIGALGTVGGDHPGLAYVGVRVDLLLGGSSR